MGRNCICIAPWARWKKFFNRRCWQNFRVRAAIGHARYSTAGDKALLNAQPIMIDCNKGKVALGHNGNLTNAAEWRRKLEHRGSIFQTNSDTEVIVHLIARSPARNLSGAIGDALNQVEGAYSSAVADDGRNVRGARPARVSPVSAWQITRDGNCRGSLDGGFRNLRV